MDMKDRWTSKHKDGSIYRQVKRDGQNENIHLACGRKDRCINIHIDRQSNKWTGKNTDRQINRHTGRRRERRKNAHEDRLKHNYDNRKTMITNKKTRRKPGRRTQFGHNQIAYK